MSDKYAALKAAAEKAKLESKDEWGYDTDAFHDEATPGAILALLAEREADKARIAELQYALGRYSMSAGEADQRRCESRAVRDALGFGKDANDVSPSDLRQRIAELLALRKEREAAVPELSAIVERLNSSGYEHNDGPVTGENAAVVVDTLLRQLDDAVQAIEGPMAAFRPVADVYELKFPDGQSVQFHHDPAKAVQWLSMMEGNTVQEYVTLERYQQSATNSPPAQPVAVPDEPPEHLLPSGASNDASYRRGGIIHGWKLCHAAMLAAALGKEG